MKTVHYSCDTCLKQATHALITESGGYQQEYCQPCLLDAVQQFMKLEPTPGTWLSEFVKVSRLC